MSNINSELLRFEIKQLQVFADKYVAYDNTEEKRIADAINVIMPILQEELERVK